MDRAEFHRHHDSALERAEHMRTYCTNDEIILVMTADFYRELLEVHAICNYGALTEVYGPLYGYRIAVINEPTEHTMVSPAILGMTYHPYMALDDIIVVDEENRVFRLTSCDPVQFTDTGMTVRFDAHTRTTRMDTAVIDAGNIAAYEIMRGTTAFEALTTTATTIGDNWQQYTATWVNPATVDAEINHSVFDRLTGGGRRKKNRVKEDTELSAGDTKAMDEFLDGFAIKQNLQQA